MTSVVEVLAALAALDRALPDAYLALLPARRQGRTAMAEARNHVDSLLTAQGWLRDYLPDLTPRPPGTALARLPVCPSGHGPLRYRPPGTREQAWCGTWFDCRDCRSSVLWPSPALREQRALYALATTYALTDLAHTPEGPHCDPHPDPVLRRDPRPLGR